jgi:hypothetical protein
MQSLQFPRLLLLLSFLMLFSCGHDDSSSPGMDNLTLRIDNLTTGQLHNEVLKNLNSRIPLRQHSVTPEKFMPAFVASINSTLKSHGVETRVREKDLYRYIAALAEIERNTEYDFSSPHNDSASVREAAVYMADRGYWKRTSAVRFLNNLRELQHGKQLNTSGTTISGTDAFADDIMLNSYDFWSTLADTIPDDFDAKDKENKWNTGLLVSDLLGGILGTMMGGAYGGLIGACLSSVIYIWSDDIDEWLHENGLEDDPWGPFPPGD